MTLGTDHMLAEERRLLIVDWTRKDGRLDAGMAAKKLSVATETVRRDLDLLERRGVLRRVHGGAIALERFTREHTIPERENIHPDAKRRIAETASRYLPQEGSVFVDGGTTTEQLAPYLRNRPKLQVVTNNLRLVTAIGDSGTKVHVLAGSVRPTTLSSIGPRTVEDLRDLNAVAAFIGANGVSADLKITAFDNDEAIVKRQMIRNAEEAILLADNSKFGATYPATFAGAADIDRVVSDVDTASEYVQRLTAADVEVVLA